MRIVLKKILAVCAAIAGLSVMASAAPAPPTEFNVIAPGNLPLEGVHGRVFVLISRANRPEVRLQSFWFDSPEFLGVDIAGLKSSQSVLVTSATFGYPSVSLTQLPAGDYYVQSVLYMYSRYDRSDGHTVWAPDQWNASGFTTAPGNLFSDVTKVHLDARHGYQVKLLLNHTVPERAPPADTQWVKRIKILSPTLTKFWGHPIYLGAIILLPKNYATETEKRYPAIYYSSLDVPFKFTTHKSPEDPAARAERVRNGYESGYEFYKSWASEHFPRMIAISIIHPTPYDRWPPSQNSESSGPYGDAVTNELIPYIEKNFRIIGKPYARALIGKETGSGGRDALALQLKYPKLFGGAWIFYPWAIDFHSYGALDIYQTDGAFTLRSSEVPLRYLGTPSFAQFDRNFIQSPAGQPLASFRELSAHDLAVGTGPRGGEFGGDDAFYGPIGKEGLPIPLFDRLTGRINKEVGQYWKTHGDLLYYAETHWSQIGPSLLGKLHFFSGDDDDFHRNLGVREFEAFLSSTTQPHYAGSFEYAPMKGNLWQPMTNAQLVEIVADYVEEHSPSGTSNAWDERRK